MKHNSRINKQRGFTLLEVMIVIVILGVLASLTVPSLMGNKDRADRQKAASDVVALENALEMYWLDNGIYPTQQQGLNALVKIPSVKPLPKNYRSDGYIRRLPKDPWSNAYQYRNPGKHGKIDVFSNGPEGSDSSHIIGNWDNAD
jgi:general secretion pathway protein G